MNARNEEFEDSLPEFRTLTTSIMTYGHKRILVSFVGLEDEWKIVVPHQLEKSMSALIKYSSNEPKDKIFALLGKPFLSAHAKIRLCMHVDNILVSNGLLLCVSDLAPSSSQKGINGTEPNPTNCHRDPSRPRLSHMTLFSALVPTLRPRLKTA
jgi:hypothetical protein